MQWGAAATEMTRSAPYGDTILLICTI